MMRFEGGKAAGVYNNSTGFVRAGVEAMIDGLDAMLFDVWQSGAIPLEWK